uniref:Uncharacterized protein n=1 Tax=Plectus sambesii TaxID=2011161 RepID=A0A914VB38_9BILA
MGDWPGRPPSRHIGRMRPAWQIARMRAAPERSTASAPTDEWARVSAFHPRVCQPASTVATTDDHQRPRTEQSQAAHESLTLLQGRTILSSQIDQRNLSQLPLKNCK